jgi:hypothetical protein
MLDNEEVINNFEEKNLQVIENFSIELTDDNDSDKDIKEKKKIKKRTTILRYNSKFLP